MQLFSEDFKYQMPDSMRLAIGASFSFDELLTMEQTSFKLKMVIRNFILKEGDETLLRPMTVAEYMGTFDAHSFTFQAFKQLKLKVKGSVVEENGQSKPFHLHIEKFMPLRDEVVPAASKQLFIEEISVSKLALMGISL